MIFNPQLLQHPPLRRNQSGIIGSTCPFCPICRKVAACGSATRRVDSALQVRRRIRARGAVMTTSGAARTVGRRLTRCAAATGFAVVLMVGAFPSAVLAQGG